MTPEDAYVVKNIKKVDGENYPDVDEDTEKPHFLRIQLENGRDEITLNLFEGDAQDMCTKMAKLLI